jgi:hypothetical protein
VARGSPVASLGGLAKRGTPATMLCSVGGQPSLSDGRLRVRGGGEVTHDHAGGAFCLEFRPVSRRRFVSAGR